MMKNFSIFAFFILLAFACETKNSFLSYQNLTGEEVLIQVDEIPFQKGYVLDSLLEVKKVIRLEGGEDIFIGSYDKVALVDGRIYILDKTMTHSLFVFTEEGEFLFKIASLGEGPKEYREIRDFTVTPNSKTLAILDFGGKKILRYATDTGTFMHTVPLDRSTYLDTFEKVDAHYIGMHANHCGNLNGCHNVSFLGSDFSTLKSDLQINDRLKNYDYKGEMSFSRNGEQVFFSELFNDTIYEVKMEDQKLQAKYAIDFGKYRLPDAFKYSKRNSKFDKSLAYALENGLTLGLHDFYCSDRFLFFRYGIPQLREVYIDLETNKAQSFDRSLTQNFLLIGDIVAMKEDHIIKVIPSEMVDDLLKTYFYTSDSLEFRSQHNVFYELAKEVHSGSSGIITFLTLTL
ncbi:MAG: 6-bladed beta-propeller [Nitritalea sp.]